MELGFYLGFYLEIRTVSLILGFGSSLVSLLRSFLLLSRSGSCEILHLFSSFFFSDLPVISLVARCFQWRARVELQVRQLSDEGSCESLRVVWICVNSCSVWCWWSNSMVNFAVFGMKLIWIGIEFDLGFVCSWVFLWVCWIWSVTEWREKVKYVSWCGAYWMDLLALCTVTGLL